jgi:hypothetical protein
MMIAIFSRVPRWSALTIVGMAAMALPASAQDSLPRRELVPAAQSVTLDDAIKMALIVRPTMVGLANARNADAQALRLRRVPAKPERILRHQSFQDAQTNSQGIPIPASSRTNYNVGLNASLNLFTGSNGAPMIRPRRPRSRQPMPD